MCRITAKGANDDMVLNDNENSQFALSIAVAINGRGGYSAAEPTDRSHSRTELAKRRASARRSSSEGREPPALISL